MVVVVVMVVSDSGTGSSSGIGKGTGRSKNCEDFDHFLYPYLFSFYSKHEKFKKNWKIVEPFQIGPRFCIRIHLLCIPCAFFFDLQFQAALTVLVRL